MISDKSKFAAEVKNKRKKIGYTQARLAELTGLSLRSIQRIEKAEVSPRHYSIKALTEVLDLSTADNNETNLQQNQFPKKIILSISSGVCLFLLAMAFISQSRTFPETNFEAFLFWTLIVLMIATIQWMVWVKWKAKKAFGR